ncbi:leader peptidase / N-methyltransferase [Novimethylophilus kurashikiensis]|uniref:Prepilin leader peptidase/N-methyltransferase n=1 Tax=Novimethylophilus kurashikiensis TaxID=1825523 RepID=A0A2R5F4D3_9PROT|nr:A24 family peptidase [Novimethylophilus kurashikiensis]GBG13272.1 leader peptidase / N-methyltransferase [Novimethylophilus kurashikiensis]
MIEILNDQPLVFAAIAVFFGLMIGSFLNVVIHRLPRMMEREWRQQCAELNNEENVTVETYNLMVPRSACPSCGHAISAMENIPVVSYLFLRGKCAGCQTRISPRYPLVELLTGLLAGAVAWKFGFGLQAFVAFLFVACLVALTFIDFDSQLLPDDLTLPLLWIGLAFNLSNGFTDLKSAVIGAIAGYLALWSVYWLFKLVTGKEGMGYGDFKLLAAIGAWFGWQLLPAVILLSSLVGSIVGIGLILLAKHGRSVPIPFGPYLALGGIAALFWGPQLAQLYLGA